MTWIYNRGSGLTIKFTMTKGNINKYLSRSHDYCDSFRWPLGNLETSVVVLAAAGQYPDTLIIH